MNDKSVQGPLPHPHLPPLSQPKEVSYFMVSPGELKAVVQLRHVSKRGSRDTRTRAVVCLGGGVGWSGKWPYPHDIVAPSDP